MQDTVDPNSVLTRTEWCWLQLRRFHEERCELIRKDEQHVRLYNEARLVVHILPEASWSAKQAVSAAKLKQASSSIKPLGGNSSSYGMDRFNADGFLLYSGDTARSYTQLYRCGRVEAVMSDLYYETNGDGKLLRPWCDDAVFSTLEGYLPFAKQIGLEPPFWCFASVLGCEGVKIPLSQSWGHVSPHSFDRSVVRLPDVLIDTFDVDPGEVLRPVLDVIANAAGLEKSLAYDESGSLQSRR